MRSGSELLKVFSIVSPPQGPGLVAGLRITAAEAASLCGDEEALGLLALVLNIPIQRKPLLPSVGSLCPGVDF